MSKWVNRTRSLSFIVINNIEITLSFVNLNFRCIICYRVHNSFVRIVLAYEFFTNLNHLNTLWKNQVDAISVYILILNNDIDDI